MIRTPRILAIRDGTEQPLFGPSLPTPASPSPSLPIETHAFAPDEWQTHVIPQQVITLFLRPAILLHAEGSGPAKRLPVATRAVAFSLRNREESIRWETPAAFTSVAISDAVLAHAAEQLTSHGHFALHAAPAVHDERLSALLHVLHLESTNDYAAGRLLVDGVEQALAALLITNYNAFRQPALSAPTALPPHAARRVQDYLHTHLAQPIGMAELVQVAGLSPAHFSRLFRASFGMPPHQYLLQLRIGQAKLMLQSQNHSMLEVALLCGFANAQHFSRTFSKITGLSPSSFRRLQK